LVESVVMWDVSPLYMVGFHQIDRDVLARNAHSGINFHTHISPKYQELI
jgi:hypothetical protein